MSVRTDVSESTRIIGGRRSAESSRDASLSMPLARRAACAGLFGLAPFLGGAASLSGVVGVGGGDGVSPMATWWSRFAIAAAAAMSCLVVRVAAGGSGFTSRGTRPVGGCRYAAIRAQIKFQGQ